MAQCVVTHNLYDHNRHFTLSELVFFCILCLFSHKVSLCPPQELWLIFLLIFCRRPWAYMLVHISNLELIGTGSSPDVCLAWALLQLWIFLCVLCVFFIHILSFRNGTHGPGMPCSNSPMVLCSREEYVCVCFSFLFLYFLFFGFAFRITEWIL